MHLIPTYRRDLGAALAGFLEPEEARAETRCWLEEGLGRSRAWLAAHGSDPVPAEEGRRSSSGWSAGGGASPGPTSWAGPRSVAGASR